MSSLVQVSRRESLRFRLAVTFAAFGALVSLLLSLGVFFAAHQLSERLMDETLRAELEDYLARRARNPTSLPPSTVGIRGYVYVPGSRPPDVPPALLDLPVGRHHLTMDEIPYRVAVVDKNNERYVMLFNEVRQRQREETFVAYLVAGAIVMILISAAAGRWLAGRAVAPVAELARRIHAARPEQEHHDAGGAFPNDEIGKLATGVFGRYVKRMRAFVDRERDFTADVSHELRTPLSIIKGVVELMEEDPRLDAKQQERVARIRRAVADMTDVTAALLLMAREDNLHEPAPRDCDVCDVVREAVDAHRHLVRPGTAVDVVCRGQPHLVAERTLLKIVVANLVRNALVHTAFGTVSIIVDDASLTITDTGEGIRGEELAKVFERHFKGTGSRGTGIGLSLVKRICDRYGWEAGIESAVGRGTSARLVFAGSVAKPASLTLS